MSPTCDGAIRARWSIAGSPHFGWWRCRPGLSCHPIPPPVPQRIPGFRPAPFGQLADTASPQFDVVRNYLRFYGPATPKEVAAFLDAPVNEVAGHWPPDAVSVSITDGPGAHDRSMLPDDVSTAKGFEKPGDIRLLGPYDGYLQLKDRPLLITDGAQSKDLWRTLGRPGAVALDGEIIGTWRPRSSGNKLTINWQPWMPTTKARRADIELQAERLAAVRGQRLTGLIET
ncbi:MAG: DNA glycosylase AlkZ-like family protein [Nakamurella sp.]